MNTLISTVLATKNYHWEIGNIIPFYRYKHKRQNKSIITDNYDEYDQTLYIVIF